MSIAWVGRNLDHFSLKNRPRTGSTVGLRELQLREIGTCSIGVLLHTYTIMSKETFSIVVLKFTV